MPTSIMPTSIMPASTTPAANAARPVAGFASDDERWEAVCARDPGAIGAFVHGVVTTGVYCRPSCPARLPRRENVRFHATCADAQRAGFRPCKRCRPDRAPA
jgi:AraC family transcriptional regulator of adaptative response/methylated-DNA-[protein]-cysteine methyltransferase